MAFSDILPTRRLSKTAAPAPRAGRIADAKPTDAVNCAGGAAGTEEGMADQGVPSKAEGR